MVAGRAVDGLRASPAWRALEAHHAECSSVTLRSLFADEPRRGVEFVAEGAGLYLDYSKNLVTRRTLELLFALADEVGVAARRDAMFSGAHVNVSEDRAALAAALRMPAGARLEVDGADVVGPVHDVLNRMAEFSARVRSGEWRGATGKRMRAVVNIGIGGSDLGPKMAYEALKHYSDRELTVRFVSNVDATAFVEAVRDLDPAETLFIVVSKTFGTLETLTNARAARAWCVAALGDDAVARHFVAVSTHADRVAAFGIDPAQMFEFWDWVGGRYSMDSAVGLSTMIAIGPDNYRELLAGFFDMDEHFRTAPPARNLPVIMGLIGVWYRNFFGYPTVGVMPYDEYLARLPAYLQQLTMESNGKHVTSTGDLVDYDTGPIYWGEPGTNGQHSFYQLLHQGTTVVPLDLIAFARSLNPLDDQHDMLVANVLAQAHALAFGRTPEELRADGVADDMIPHHRMEGNRPTNIVLTDVCSPRRLGAIVALYEHVVFVQGTVWGVDSFDQWGVELGKTVAAELLPALTSAAAPDLGPDSSTSELIRRYRTLRAQPGEA